jgi:hypothetical protein
MRNFVPVQQNTHAPTAITAMRGERYLPIIMRVRREAPEGPVAVGPSNRQLCAPFLPASGSTHPGYSGGRALA